MILFLWVPLNDGILNPTGVGNGFQRVINPLREKDQSSGLLLGIV